MKENSDEIVKFLYSKDLNFSEKSENLIVRYKICFKMFSKPRLLNRLIPNTVQCLQKRPTCSIKDELIQSVSQSSPYGSKVTVVGCGNVGIACTMGILANHLNCSICLVDVNEKKLKAEILDLQQGSVFLHDARITGSTNYADTAGSKVCIITSGVTGKGKSRLKLVNKNAEIVEDIVKKLVEVNPETILLVVSNPVDIMSYVAWKTSDFPHHRVIGSGTFLDAGRFRCFIAQKLGIAPSSVDACVIGEHGDSSVPVWSGVSVAGTNLRTLVPDLALKSDKENWHEVHTRVVKAAAEIIALKRYTSWAIGLGVAAIVAAIIGNKSQIIPVSTMAKGYHGIGEETYLSLPCILGYDGIEGVVIQKLLQDEKDKLLKSAEIILKAQNSLKKECK